MIVPLGTLLGMFAEVLAASPALARVPKWQLVPAAPFTLDPSFCGSQSGWPSRPAPSNQRARAQPWAQSKLQQVRDPTMAAEDSSFNSSGDTVVSFATINSKGRPAFGVSADADTCGVYGQGGPTPPPHSPTPPRPGGTGVLGRGEFHGVYGVSAAIDDADTPEFGSGAGPGIAVVGVNKGESPAILADNGILSSDSSRAMDDLPLEQMGVAGITRRGPGVFGVSLGDGPSDDLRTDPQLDATVKGTEFTDVTQPNVPHAGVMGLSMHGPGVRGVSRFDRGGVFESAQEGDSVVAQLRLFPTQSGVLELEPRPPRDAGEAGDLLALSYVDGNLRIRASLWFCAEGVSTSPDRTADWRQIV
jgi:hypothetical protein